MSKKPRDEMLQAKQLMGALVRMKPKPHEELKKKKPTPNKRTPAKKKQATK
jgi:hypothetical protein